VPMEKDPLNLIIAGVGGQGNVLASQIVANTAIVAGYQVTMGETYGATQRGGAVMSHIRISREAQYGPVIPEGKADIIVGLEPVETLRVIGDFGNPETRVILNPRPNYPIGVLSGEAQYPPVEEVLKAIAGLVESLQVIEATRIIVMVGALAGSGLIPVKVETFEAVIPEIVSGGNLELNLKAFNTGLKEIQSIKPYAQHS
jgi:indolepyruvate ferredoxin oxidoreductase beta subunit